MSDSLRIYIYIYIYIYTYIHIYMEREEGRKELFYLTMHSTHLKYSYMESDMVKDYSYCTNFLIDF